MQREEEEEEEEEEDSVADKRPASSPPSPPSTSTANATTVTNAGPSTCTALLLNNSTQLPAQDQQHLTHFTHQLQSHTRPLPLQPPLSLLPIPHYTTLYHRNAHALQGAHFVVTQHDHPIAGPHYDLRLQINQTSSCSWAIMYGLPGDPNARGKSGRGGGAGCMRGAVETRVHCLWNHLVETGGWEVGSLLIWDMGEYEVLRLPRPKRRGALSDSGEEEDEDGDEEDDDDDEEEEEEEEEDERGGWHGLTQQEKLARAFADRKIRLRLKGWRLPRGYVVNLRLTKEEDALGRDRAAARAVEGGEGARRRRRRGVRLGPVAKKRRSRGRTGPDTSSSGDDNDNNNEGNEREEQQELRELEDEEVRRMNAYPGACNTIGSVHQRKWFMSLDREACGFVRVRRQRRTTAATKEEEEGEGKEDGRAWLQWPFYVRGPEHERSIVTGRLGSDVLRDEGVVGFVGRKGWRPILH
ncbi:hypothetical protein M406DRAFT_258227 [Cryphonectria parasitica EP155]|uniref:DNA ligase D 3'-phosphoesterase domain-containing protein n=1 Tax=Cryphonectria parasitica (strain ATCC 38755 / EP155) TaxID=660469 RepID=A0A9P4Y173_CRYP1|nr:uncharacterized protein M406DRAFT_258227 [Cryphonectria parasitica EP155]KAF3764502.1 hypothetical protein M406DRAFT_258227 [Cryphonectria parasitica EP155]